MTATDLAVYVAAFLVGALAVARLTRLVVEDHWPPVEWLRDRWDRWTNRSKWNLLLHCGYCFAPWATIPVLAWAWISDLHWTWWLVMLWLAVSYAAAIIVSYDGGD